MVPAAPLPWVFSQTSRPEVAQAGIAVWLARAAPGAARAEAGIRAAAQASAPTVSSRRAAVVRRFMTGSPFEKSSLDGSPSC